MRLLYLLPLAFALWIPADVFGQGGCRGGGRQPVGYMGYGYPATVAAPAYTAGGCTGYTAGFSARLTMGAGCSSSRPQTYGFPVAAAPAYAAGGCTGRQTVQMGFPAATYQTGPPPVSFTLEAQAAPSYGPAYTADFSQAFVAAPQMTYGPIVAGPPAAGPVYGSVAAGVPVYAVAGDSGQTVLTTSPRYGDRAPSGEYYTPTGLPAGPGILGEPGAPWGIANGPIREVVRRAIGRDEGAPTRGFGSYRR
jgi:hypothetical protein